MRASLQNFGLIDVDAIRAELDRRQQYRRSRSIILSYLDRPAHFARDMIHWNPGERPASYQYEILEALYEQKRYSIRGPHGLGKSMMAAVSVHWFALTRDGLDWKIPTTASAWRQLTKFLWPEVHKWSRRLRWERIGRPMYNDVRELQTLNLKLETGEAFALASDQPALMEGAHADHIYYIFDESKTIPEATFDAAEGAFTGAHLEGKEALALSLSTPGECFGRFHAIQTRKPGYEDWGVRHVTLVEAIAAGRISQKWADDRKRQWREDSPMYQNRCLGEFATGDTGGIVPLAWVEAANQRWLEWRDSVEVPLTKPLTAVGVDVGEGGPDQTVFALRKEWTIVELRKYPRQRLMECVGRVKGIILRYGGIGVVDVIGIGSGVVGRLREMRIDAQGWEVAEGTEGAHLFPVVGFNASSTKVKDPWTGQELKDWSGELGFLNLRAAAWWHLRELLDPDKPGEILLPPDDELTADLTIPTWRVHSGGKIQVESADDLRKPERLGRSPDTGTAVVEAFAAEWLYDELGYDVWGGGESEDYEDAEETIARAVLTEGAYFPTPG